MAYGLSRYVADDTDRDDVRQRLHALLSAHKRAGSSAHREQERLVREAERDAARGFGNDIAGGAATGFAMSGGNPYGALAGGALGATKGMSRAYKDRRKDGQSKFEAGWRTLFDVENWIPDFGTAAQAASIAAPAMAGKQRRGEDPFSRMESLSANPTISHGQGVDDSFSLGDFGGQLEMDPETQMLIEEALRQRGG